MRHFVTTFNFEEGDAHLVEWDREHGKQYEQEESASGVVELDGDRLVWSAEKSAHEHTVDYLRCAGDMSSHDTREELGWAKVFRYEYDSGRSGECEFDGCVEEVARYVALELSEYFQDDDILVSEEGGSEAVDIEGDWRKIEE